MRCGCRWWQRWWPVRDAAVEVPPKRSRIREKKGSVEIGGTRISFDVAAIRAIIEDWAAVVRRKDMAGIPRHHAPDISMFDVPPPFQLMGIAASCPGRRCLWPSTSKRWRSAPEARWHLSRQRCNVPAAADGGTSPLDFRLAVGWRKIDGQWTICHAHHSVPAAFRGDSGRNSAATCGAGTIWRILTRAGSLSRTRTCDRSINSRLLYQLSYQGIGSRI
jgi:ketosteroid isomerase-like protein